MVLDVYHVLSLVLSRASTCIDSILLGIAGIFAGSSLHSRIGPDFQSTNFFPLFKFSLDHLGERVFCGVRDTSVGYCHSSTRILSLDLLCDSILRGSSLVSRDTAQFPGNSASSFGT